jgi:hypothetical protein
MLFTGLVACSGEGNSQGSGAGGSGDVTSNLARFTFDCDLQGLNGELQLDVEAVNTTGIVYGPGPNPDISGVIGTGSVTYITAGSLRSATAQYVFTGDNQFADFTDVANSQRFRVQWVPNAQGLTMVINPFGPGPTQHTCVLNGAQYL